MLRGGLDFGLCNSLHVMACRRSNPSPRQHSKFRDMVVVDLGTMGEHCHTCPSSMPSQPRSTQGAGAGLMHSTRTGGNCLGHPPISRLVSENIMYHIPHELRALASRCRQSLTVEALGWTEFSLCCVTMIVTLVWIRSSSVKKTHAKDSRTFV